MTRAFLLILLPALSGCAAQPKPERIDADVWRSPHANEAEESRSVLVVDGPPPLVYQLQDAANVRVVDSTSGQQMAMAAGHSGQIVSVEAEQGIRLGGQPLSGSLPADHNYSIYLDVEPSHVSRPFHSQLERTPPPR